ncbi:hypothetical protein PoB_003092800 [Plakobranchus ocellatus]|uniref:Uncharacterized protein n=1 Tax=Plakobranchus ocellatus TaxID=259542 RepID=A0AAV4AD04_9GAST|nr:hypothetical protein PoB_003092800 [Plakobranchus ocellatus]
MERGFGDPRLSNPPSGQTAGNGPRTRDERVFATSGQELSQAGGINTSSADELGTQNTDGKLVHKYKKLEVSAKRAIHAMGSSSPKKEPKDDDDDDDDDDDVVDGTGSGAVTGPPNVPERTRSGPERQLVRFIARADILFKVHSPL